MTSRLPFTLAPLAGEPFGVWWHAYASRLGVTRTELAHAAGIPAGSPPGPGHATAIAAATGPTASQVTAMFTTARSCPPEYVLRVWTPQPTSRFCPRCLAEDPRWRPEWALPLTFHCLSHNAPLARHCPGCGQAPPSRLAPAAITQSPSLCPVCGHDLSTDQWRHADRGDAANASAQQLITMSLTRMHDPAATAQDREQAQHDLTDLTLVALHLTQSEVSKQRGFTHRMPDAAAFTDAATLLATPPPDSGRDRLGELVTRCLRGPRSRAIPFSWRTASPALITRIARDRDAALTPIERLRYATTLPTAMPRPPHRPDPAPARAARLPDQLWPVWAIRLTDDDSLDGPVFRTAMIAALLLPHSDLQLGELTSLLPHQPERTQVTHQLRRLAATPDGRTALRILTELGLALDHHDIPIDYARRRQLVVDTELIDQPTWIRYCRDAGLRSGGLRRLGLAHRYLYELLTGGNLATAPHPYRLDIGAPRLDHVEFCASMPASLVTALTDHAEQLLAVADITGEPLSWHPPADWVTVTDWPGADPDRTDPAPIHDALQAQWSATPHPNWWPTQACADSLGISSHHLRHVLRQHPTAHAPYRQHRSGAILAMASGDGSGYRVDPHPDDPKRIFHVDLRWLREQYFTWGRPLLDIATEIGCGKGALRAFAEAHNLPLRPRSGGSTHIAVGTIPGHPADLPELLRNALRGQRARDRLRRFLTMTEYPSLTQAAAQTGLNQPTLTAQLKNLEQSCGGPLFQRPHPRALGPLTPLGEQLCHQAHEHLNLTPDT